MLNELGEGAIDETFFDSAGGAFSDVLTTTWDELQEQEWLQRVEAVGEYRFTGTGWLGALQVTGKLSEDTFARKVGLVFAAMKSYVKGRKESKVVTLRELAAKAGATEGFVFNVVESKLLERHHGRQGASWLDKGRMVLIPTGFNIEPTDLKALIEEETRLRIEELEDKLQMVEDELGQYHCPHCNASLSSSGSVELDEHNDGYYEVFGCGYARMDGCTERLCPKDPQFPKLEDFELRTHQSGDQWYCYALPKTANARKVDISGQPPGKTEEEAKQRLIERYKYIKGELKWNEMWPFKQGEGISSS